MAGRVKHHGWLLVLLLVAAVYRFAFLMDNPIDYDEAYHAAMAKLPLSEIFAMRQNYPPAFHLLLHGWVRLLGVDDLVLRLFAWLMGLLGIGLSYGLAYELTRSRPMAIMTAVFVAFSPFHIRYSRLLTVYSAWFVLVLASWWLFLRLLQLPPERSFWRSPLTWLYCGVTLAGVHLQALGPVFWAMQGIYFLLIAKYLPAELRRNILIVGVFAGLTFLPELIIIMQPWHSMQVAELRMNHLMAPLPVLLLAPVRYLLSGANGLPAPLGGTALVLGILVYGMLIVGYRFLKEQLAPRWRQAVLWIGIYPLPVLFVVSHLIQEPVFLYRQLIFAVFSISLLAAAACRYWGLKHRPMVAVGLLSALVAGQLYYWQVRAEELYDRSYRAIIETVRAYRKPEDGIVIIPGYHHLPLMKAIEPSEFGLTETERYPDYPRENTFNMVNRLDEKHYFVSATHLSKHPEIPATFQQFARKHARVWFISHPFIIRRMLPYFPCKTTVITQGPDNGFWEVRCPPDHPDHCRRPLGETAWRCPNKNGLPD